MKPLPAPAEPRRFDVVGLGGNAADFLVTVPRHPQPDEKLAFGRFSRQGGGRAATAMVTVARLGLRAAYLGGVGDDREGEENLQELRREGVDVGGVLVRPGAMTQRAFILVNESNGERTVLWGRGPEIPLQAGEIDPERVRAGRLFYTDAHLPPASVRAARIAREAGIPVLVDLESMRPGAADLLPLVDYLVCSAALPALATGIDDLEESLAALERLSQGAVVVVTQGADGAVARIDGRLESFPGYQVEVADTTGAGDVFHGAFAAAILRGADLREAIDFSNAAAAMKCRSLGARDGIPRGLEAVEAFRKQARGPG
jgi:sugar/nucleoside kinase (ribokinase family)